jgi:hypothetical protein
MKKRVEANTEDVVFDFTEDENLHFLRGSISIIG